MFLNLLKALIALAKSLQIELPGGNGHMSVSLQNSYVVIPTRNGIRPGAFGKYLGQKGEALVMRLVPYRKTREAHKTRS